MSDRKMWLAVGLAGLALVGLGIGQACTEPPGTAPPLTGEAADMYQPPKADRSPSCTRVTGTQAERFATCLSQLRVPPLSKGARSQLDDIAKSGKVLTIGPSLGISHDQLAPSEELVELLLTSSERDVAAAIRDLGVRGVVVHRDLTQALDRDATVISRLAQHDHLEWFQLRRVTEELFIYTVRSTPSTVPLTTGALMLEGLRARLDGREPPKQQWRPTSAVRLLASARLQGHTLMIRHAIGKDLESVLEELARKLEREWDRKVAIEGHGLIEDRLGDIRLELHVVMERAEIEPRSPYALFELFELGVDGFFLRRAKGLKPEKFTYMPGSEAVPRSFKSAEALLKHGVREFGWNHPKPWEDKNTRFDLMRTSHFMEKQRGGGGGVVRLVRGMPESSMADLSDDRIRDMLVAGGEWWLYNQQDDDSFTYKYWPEQNRYSVDYNEVRHLLGVRDLVDVYRYRKDPRYLHGARRAMDWIMNYVVRDTDPPHAKLPHPPEASLLFRYPFKPGEVRRKAPNQKLGTVAVAILGWIPYAKATGDRSLDRDIRGMARFVLSRLEPNGRFDPYYVHRGHSYYNNKNDIVPGQGALALGMVAEYFDEPEWIESYPKFLDYYEPWFRSRAKRVQPTGRWPHGTYKNQDRLDMVQFGPWSVMASKQYYMLTGDERAAAFGLEVADWMIDNYQWSGERSPFPDYIGGYYKLPTELPAMQSFCYSEGTAAAYHIAARYKPDHKEKYDLSTREAIRFMDVMQFDETSSYFAVQPDIIIGGVKYAMNEQKVRTDYVGHGLSTLSQYLDARSFDPAVELELRELSLDEPPAGERGSARRQIRGDEEDDDSADEGEEGED